MSSTTQARSNRPAIRRAAAVAAAALLTLLSVTAVGNARAGAQGDDPLVVLVSNDDGIGADGIDALVEALRARPDTTVVVSAPAENQSGSSDKTTPGGASAAPGTTQSGYAGTAVDGFPADAVQHALDNPGPEGAPDLVMTGSNEGQNIGRLAKLSGTVGSAQTGARAGIPAVAVSQGFGDPVDYPSSVGAAMDWLDTHEAAIRDGSEPVQVTSINAPSCAEGTNRGVVEVPWDGSEDTDIGKQDCTSTLENPSSDVEAFNNGFTSLAIRPNDFPDEEEEPTTTTAPPSSTDDAPASGEDTAAAPLAPTFTG
ncbi:MAG: 5'/3'-nucleotidase SurE [Microthrixaceae bacterium]